jgi:hypothetical protein
METARRGWLALTVNKEQCVAEWNLVDTVHKREYSATVDRRLFVNAGAIGEGLQE